MKIVEIIVLMGTQCVSPIQHTPAMTEVSKVQCAVVIEKDSVTNAVEVSPPAAVSHPTVIEAMVRLQQQPAPSTAATPSTQPFRIVPAAVARREVPAPIQPPLPLQPDRALESAGEPELQAAAPPSGAQPDTASTPETEIANLAAEPQDPVVSDDAATTPEPEPEAQSAPAKPRKSTASKGRKTAAAGTSNLPDRCTGTAKAKWYTNKDGRKKYRCVSGDSAAAKKTSGTPKTPKGLY